MTPEEREQLNRLCKQIIEEKGHERFMQVVKELNELLERKGHRLESSSENSKSN